MPLPKKTETLLRKLQTRHGCRKEKLCVCEGLRSVEELFLRAPELVRFTLLTEAAKGAHVSGTVYEVTEKELAEYSGTVNSQGILAVAETPAELPPDAPLADPFILALDQLGDPGNFGTICRTARAVGLHEIWFTKGSIDPFGDKAIRASMGAQFSMKFRSFETLDELRKNAETLGCKNTYITDPHDGENCFTAPDLFEHTVLVIGGEANGATMIEQARHVMIPMPGKFESLNAAQAATVFLFEYVRRGLLS